MKKLFKIPLKFLHLIYFLIALVLITVIVFYFGKPILGPGLPGSDNTNFVTLAHWLYKWFPNIPFWYPQQGAGVSFTTYYPILTHLIVVSIAKLLSLNLLVVFRYYALISIILTSIGIYFLAVRFTKNRTVALLSSVFYPLSSIAWTLMLGWGFFAEHASYIFVAPAIIFFELYLINIYKEQNVLKTRIFMFLFLVFSIFTLLAHPLTFLGLIMIIVPFFIVYPLFVKERSKTLLKKSIFTGITLLFVLIFLSLFFLVPFFRYQKIVSSGAAKGEFVASRGLMLQNSIYFKTFFNLDPKPVIYQSLDDKILDRSADGWHNIAFPIAISIFALIGLIGSFFLKRKLFALGFANLFSLTIALSPEILFFFFKTPVLNYLGNWRALIIPSRLIIPVLAGFGCYTIGYLLSYPLKYLSLKIKGKVLGMSFLYLFMTISSVLAMLVAVFGLYYFRNWPNSPSYLISYGPETYYLRSKPDLRNIWGKEIDFCNDYEGWEVSKIPAFCSNKDIKETFWYKKLDKTCAEVGNIRKSTNSSIEKLCAGNINREEIDNLLKDCQNISNPDMEKICSARVKTLKEQILSEDVLARITVSELGKELVVGNEIKLIKKLPNDSSLRLDVGPGLGSILMAEPYYSSMPELGVYYNQSSLIPLMWNYQIASFYSNSEVWSQPEIVDELSKYFGLSYAFFSETNMPIEKFEKNWERIDQIPDIFGVLGFWKYKYSTGLITASTKPVILVIGDVRTEAYFRTFHLANIGGISYDDAILVDGGEFVDNFSSQDLSKFDAIIMDGYKYKNKKSAWSRLEDYVKEGGSLYVNTGWQYVSQDWQEENLPEFFPMLKLEWTSVGETKNFNLEDKKIAENIVSSEISPLVYGDTAWNISSSDKSNLRNWANIVLSADGKPLIAKGNFGKGKVVWTGLDLAGHIGAYKDNPSEVKLYSNLMKYLLERNINKEVKISFERNYPDKVEFIFGEDMPSKTAVYWKEAYHPDFKAKFVEGNKKESIPVYKAGPGLTMFILPNVTKGSKIIYEYKIPFIANLARLISFLSFVTVLIVVLKPQLLNKFRSMVIGKISKHKIRKKLSINYGKDEDIDY